MCVCVCASVCVCAAAVQQALFQHVCEDLHVHTVPDGLPVLETMETAVCNPAAT